MNGMPDRLLAGDEPEPVTVRNENGRSPFLIVADHAGNSLPRARRRQRRRASWILRNRVNNWPE